MKIGKKNKKVRTFFVTYKETMIAFVVILLGVIVLGLQIAN